MKEILYTQYVDISVNSFTDGATDLIKGVLILIIGLAIVITVIMLFFAIVAIAKEKDDQEERMSKIKHSIIVGVCLGVEVILAILIFTLL